MGAHSRLGVLRSHMSPVLEPVAAPPGAAADQATKRESAASAGTRRHLTLNPPPPSTSADAAQHPARHVRPAPARLARLRRRGAPHAEFRPGRVRGRPLLAVRDELPYC